MENERQDDSISLNKYISSTGICSRREADELIKSGRVKINGKPTSLGNRVAPGDKVTLDGKKLRVAKKYIYLALNKPVGIVSTTDRKEKKNIISFINYGQRIFPIGRLDKDSQGLILLTNDGDIVNKVLRAGNQHEKEYIVTVDKPIQKGFLEKMAKGVPILDTVTKPCKTSRVDKYTFRIILTEGMNRQIRRMCEHLGYYVKRLERIRIMNILLEDLPLGKHRKLTGKELAILKGKLKHSVKTEEASVKEAPKKKTNSKKSKR